MNICWSLPSNNIMSGNNNNNAIYFSASPSLSQSPSQHPIVWVIIPTKWRLQVLLMSSLLMNKSYSFHTVGIITQTIGRCEGDCDKDRDCAESLARRNRDRMPEFQGSNGSDTSNHIYLITRISNTTWHA